METQPAALERRVSATGPQGDSEPWYLILCFPSGPHVVRLSLSITTRLILWIGVSVQDVPGPQGLPSGPADGHLVLNPEQWDTSSHDTLDPESCWPLSCGFLCDTPPARDRVQPQGADAGGHPGSLTLPTPPVPQEEAVTTRQAQGSDSPGGLHSALGSRGCPWLGERVQASYMASSGHSQVRGHLVPSVCWGG